MANYRFPWADSRKGKELKSRSSQYRRTAIIGFLLVCVSCKCIKYKNFQILCMSDFYISVNPLFAVIQPWDFVQFCNPSAAAFLIYTACNMPLSRCSSLPCSLYFDDDISIEPARQSRNGCHLLLLDSFNFLFVFYYFASRKCFRKFGSRYKFGNCHKSDLLLFVGLPILGALSYSEQSRSFYH